MTGFRLSRIYHCYQYDFSERHHPVTMWKSTCGAILASAWFREVRWTDAKTQGIGQIEIVPELNPLSSIKSGGVLHVISTPSQLVVMKDQEKILIKIE